VERRVFVLAEKVKEMPIAKNPHKQFLIFFSVF